ncbi:hypothetical protein KQX54_004055 [Cotesia glomerata]|uniref:Uncharacterized protein n=1 Tax=Cotesia glomerata TaxID=32391 RepID=A0AAV7IHU7_COTGL|nr:hypothetical protein KQX54_004055 [Cotesia glomerata]
MSSSDESSDSTEYLVPSSKIDLTSSFFSTSASTSKSNPKKQEQEQVQVQHPDYEVPQEGVNITLPGTGMPSFKEEEK